MTRRGHPRLAYTTAPKRVWLTPQAVELIDGWRGRQGLTFSAALEALARLGLRQAPPDAYCAPLEAALRGAVRGELARVTALLAASALDAHAAYLVALHLAKRQLSPQQYAVLKQSSRLHSRDTLRRRTRKQALAELAAVLADPALGVQESSATEISGGPGWPS
jgi:hypothetical protein